MSMSSIIILVFCLFFLLLFLRMPIGFVFFTTGFLGITLTRSFDTAAGVIGIAPMIESANYILVAIPLFILMGQFVAGSGLSKELYNAVYKWTGRVHGGLAHATIVACSLFAACSGSSMAAVGTIGPISMSQMDRHNYKSYLSTGSITSGGTLGIMIPPSLAFIVVGYLCDVPIGPLFIAGIIPGILLTIMLMLTVYVICVLNPLAGPGGSSSSWKDKLLGLKGIWWTLVIFVIIFGGIYAGFFTPTEAGGVSAAAVFIILLLYRKMSWKVFIDALRDTVRTSCMIFTIFIGAKVFNTFLGLTGIPQMAVETVSQIGVHPVIILGIILFALIPLGCFIDAVPLATLTLPTVYPIIQKLGIDPLWFSVLFVLVAQISLLTPPVGMNVYVLSGVTGKPATEIFKGVFVFYIPMILTLIMLFAFPWLSIFLPATMK